MSFSIPKFHETFLPILKVLENGEELSYQDLKVKVRDAFYSHLPADLLSQKTSTGHLLIGSRIGWAKSYLKEGKFIEQPRRAFVKITPKGLVTLKAGHLTLS